MARQLLVVRAEGGPYELGREHGRQCRDLIRRLVREILPREASGSGKVDLEAFKRKALDYKPYIESHAPHLLEEIRGIADGAGLEFEEALFLQCRSELVYRARAESECTSFAIAKGRSATGEVIVGQNLDLPPAFEEAAVVLCLYPKHGPAILTWTLAGTLAQVGLNSAGLARCGNVLMCPGWRVGLPTTVLWRLILEERSVDDAERVVANSYRAKSNNFMLGDSLGTIADIETTVDDHRRLEPENGVLLHTNHYLHADLRAMERSNFLKDSQVRLNRLDELFAGQKDKIGVAQLKGFLSDHAGRPHCICKHEGQSKTVVSVIIHPKAGLMEVCPGNPCEGEYYRYQLQLWV